MARRQTSEQIEKILQVYRDALEDFSDDLNRKLAEDIRKKGLVASGDLIRSLRVQVVGQVNDALDEVRVSFLSHGRFREMRNIRTTGRMIPVVASPRAPGSENYNLEQWVRQRLSSFGHVPGYKNDRRPLSEIPNAARRIGFAIARSKQKEGKHRARKWYISNVYDLIFSDGGLVNQILDNITPEAAQLLQDGISKREVKLM